MKKSKFSVSDAPVSCRAEVHFPGVGDGQIPPGQQNPLAPYAAPPPESVFIRMPNGPRRELWSGSPLNYWKLQRLVSPGAWNNNTPPIRAYRLKKLKTGRGTVLIERADIDRFWESEFQRENPSFHSSPGPVSNPPKELKLPPPKQFCPVTQLKRTVMFELTRKNSLYGDTGIFITHYKIPGRDTDRIAIQTQSLLTYIRSCPPPRYKITNRTFPPKKWKNREPKFPNNNLQTPKD